MRFGTEVVQRDGVSVVQRDGVSVAQRDGVSVPISAKLVHYPRPSVPRNWYTNPVPLYH
ncbi:MAG: hypothetical protein FWE96_05235 [Coriobacteriia bacterium]|nr:hypothetical protein [Coriobacteriia bacterium]